MRTRTLVVVSTVLVAYLFGHLWFNVRQITQSPASPLRISPNEILGSSLVWQEKEWPLSFEDHVALVSILNQAQAYEGRLGSLEPLPYYFLLYRAKQAPEKVELFAKLQAPLVFRLSDWYEGGLEEVKPGGLTELVEKSHD